MPDTLLLKEYVIAAKEETTLGTAESPDATDADYLIHDPEPPEHGVDFQQRGIHGTASKLAGVAGARMGTFRFKNWMHGKGSTGLPEWGLLLQGCGMYLDSTTYKLVTGGPATAGNFGRTLTIGSYINGVRYLGAGCMGNAKLIYENGKQPYAEFEFMGKFSAFADVAMITPTIPTEPAIRAANLTFTWDSWTPTADRVEIDLQNEVVVRQDMSSVAGDSGYLYATVVDRDPIIKVTVEMQKVATKDLVTAYHTGTAAAFNLDCGEGAGTFNNIHIDAPKARIRELSFTERDKILAADLTFELTRNAADDDELTIDFPEDL